MFRHGRKVLGPETAAIVRSDKDMPNMTYPNALIKMHGDYTIGNIVLAENDYYNYPKTFALTRAFVQSLFASKLIVFVGFSFADINLKMILNDVKNILEERMQPVYMLSLNKPDNVTQKYFENKGINIVYLEDAEITKLSSKKRKDLEKEFSIKSSTASDILNYLEKENYIVRITSCNDSRYKELSLTNKANNMIVDIKKIINKTVMTLTKDISEEDKKTFFKVIDKIIEHGKKEENYGKHFKV